MLPIKLTITSIVDKIPASTQETHDPTFESEIRMVVDGMVGPADELADDPFTVSSMLTEMLETVKESYAA